MARVSEAVRLLGARDIRGIAGRLGVHPTKRLGQNFVVEPGTVRQIAALAGARAGDVILEVGPGLGSLTLALLEAALRADAQLVAVEIDPVLAAELPKTIAERAPDAADRVTVLTADALALGEKDVGAPAPTVLAANLPYNVAVPVVLRLLAALPSVERGVVMVQAEVADRMCAGPGSRVYGVPSAKLAWYADARLGRNGASRRLLAGAERGLQARCVHPPRPAADHGKQAGGLRGDRRRLRPAPQDPAGGPRDWAGSPARAEEALRAADVDPGARGEALTVAEFARIAEFDRS